MKETMEALLARTTYRQVDMEHFLDPAKQFWSKFDPDLGYLLVDCEHPDGVDGSITQYRYEPGGQRKMVNYADQPCRINTYGNSYTLCHQVSDGETWQEMLAAHLREPIRNFGIGGWSSYTSYLQAQRVEPGECGAEYVILGIFDDDHTRNIDATRWVRARANGQVDLPDPQPLNGIPWAHLRFDLKTGRWVKHDGLCRTEDDIRALCDPKKFYEAFKDDTVIKLLVLSRGGDADNLAELEALAEAFDIKVDLRNESTRATDAMRLQFEYGFQSTRFMLIEMRDWLASMGKKLMVMLTYGGRFLEEVHSGLPRFDQTFLDWLPSSDVPYVDTMRIMLDECGQYGMDVKHYVQMHYIPPTAAAVWSHYSPVANHKFAFWVKDAVIEWMDPKPPAYRF